MTASLVVEHLDVVEQVHLGLAEAGEAIGQLALDHGEEPLHDGAVVAVAAIALVWIAADGPNLVPAAEAQDRTPTRVVVVGWEDGSAGSRSLPLPIDVAGWTDLKGARYQFPEPYPVEKARQQGAGLRIRSDQ
jgi:hypothetical protein